MAGENSSEAPETIEQVEKEGYLDFDNLNPEQKERLRTHIEQWNGLMRVLIHPIYDLFPDQEEGEPDTKQLKIFNQIIKRDEKEAPPILILEDERDIDLFKDILSKAKSVIKNEPYIISTVSNTPYPVVGGREKIDWRKGYILRPGDSNFKAEQKYVDDSLGNLTRTLMDLGVKRILVGGRNLVFNEDTKKFVQCVPNFMRGIGEFSGGAISMDVSEGTEPLSGGEFREIRRQLKNKKGE